MLTAKLQPATPVNSCFIDIGQGLQAIVDKPCPPNVLCHKWYAVRWNFRYYAFSKVLVDGTPCSVSMHRLIARTPKGEICHHLNRNSLDNRFANLLNCTNELHKQLHGIRKWRH